MPIDRRASDHLEDETYHTLADAARRLSISETTLRKWIGAGLVCITLIGPPGHALKRIAETELERLKRIA